MHAAAAREKRAIVRNNCQEEEPRSPLSVLKKYTKKKLSIGCLAMAHGPERTLTGTDQWYASQEWNLREAQRLSPGDTLYAWGALFAEKVRSICEDNHVPVDQALAGIKTFADQISVHIQNLMLFANQLPPGSRAEIRRYIYNPSMHTLYRPFLQPPNNPGEYLSVAETVECIDLQVIPLISANKIRLRALFPTMTSEGRVHQEEHDIEIRRDQLPPEGDTNLAVGTVYPPWDAHTQTAHLAI